MQKYLVYNFNFLINRKKNENKYASHELKMHKNNLQYTF